MSTESQILDIINAKLKNPIYQTMQLLKMKSILNTGNFHKKEGVGYPTPKVVPRIWMEVDR
jgi:hypothetical protein